jgi:DNA-binding CsgD family transcriptional regulator
MVLPGGRLVELGFIAAIGAKSARRSPTEIVTPSLTPLEEWSSLEWGSSVVAMIELATERKTTPITARQREVVALIAAGYSNDEVGVRLGISPRTAKAHCDVLRHKLGVPRRRQIPIAFRLLTGEDPLSAGRRYLKAARLPR